MSRLPIVSHFLPTASRESKHRAVRLAAEIRNAEPALEPRELFRPLVADRIDDGPTLHLDDLSSIPLLDRFHGVVFIEDRARLRAMDGDLVASCTPRIAAFERYCQERLGLGTVAWLRPYDFGRPLAVATACWRDRTIRRELVSAARDGRLHAIEPHMGTFGVWALAALVSRAARTPLKVIAPPPALAAAVNDKVWFASVVQRLLGDDAIPPTAHASSFATLASVVRGLADRARRIVVKVPNSAGGAGNLVLDTTALRGRALGEIRRGMKERLQPLGWNGQSRLLVSSWEEHVLCAPSVQLWIPPCESGVPLVEGVYEQEIEGEAGEFAGSRPATFGVSTAVDMVDRCWLIALLFQHLGYVGRCSFDLLLIGRDHQQGRFELIECNGRWGGTSIPMTLMNRLFGDWTHRPYVSRGVTMPTPVGCTFADLLAHFSDDLYDARNGHGRYIFFNPLALDQRPGVDAIVLGDTFEAANECAAVELPKRLAALAAAASPAA